MKSTIPTKRQWIMIAYLPFHFAWYFILEHAVTTSYYPIGCALDGRIPFCEWFIFPYFTWFPYMVAAGLYFILKDHEAFERYMLSLIVGFFISTLICSVFPNGQNLRPDFYRNNFAAQIVKWTQEFDTNTNVFPSMHVVGALGTAIAVASAATLRKKIWLRILNVLLCTAIILATVFLKQHSVLDIFGGVVVAGVTAFVVYKGYASALVTLIERALDKRKG